MTARDWHPFVNDGTGRCAARPLGHGQFPVCDQWAGNDVHQPPPYEPHAHLSDLDATPRADADRADYARRGGGAK